VDVGSLVFWLTFPREESEFVRGRDALEFSPVRNVSIDGSPAMQLAQVADSPFLEFLIEGEKAGELWDRLYDGGEFSVEAQKEDSSRVSFVVADIPTADFRLRADQFDACVTAMTRDLEMHQALTSIDELP